MTQLGNFFVLILDLKAAVDKATLTQSPFSSCCGAFYCMFGEAIMDELTIIITDFLSRYVNMRYKFVL